MPDLVLAIGAGGVHGYVEWASSGVVKAASGATGVTDRRPLYASDGQTVVGYLPGSSYEVLSDDAR